MKALYDTQTAKLLPWPRIDEEPVVGLAAHLLEMAVTQEPQPSYDPATQRLEKTEVIDAEAQTVTRGWIIINIEAPTYTAEQWLDTQGLSLSRTPVFLYLRQSGAQGPKLDATEAYLNGILAQFAQDPSPRTAEQWGAAPWSFEETVAEAVGSLSQ